MKFKITSLLIFLIAFATICSAQSFFKSVPKASTRTFMVRDPKGSFGVAMTADSTLNAFRPITNIAAYAEPGNVLMAGAGISYQHLKYDFTNAKWKSIWSIAGMMWAGGSVAPQTPADAISYGLMVGFFNNLIMVGPAYNGGLKGSKIQGVVSIGINLNN